MLITTQETACMMLRPSACSIRSLQYIYMIFTMYVYIYDKSYIYVAISLPVIVFIYDIYDVCIYIYDKSYIYVAISLPVELPGEVSVSASYKDS